MTSHLVSVDLRLFVTSLLGAPAMLRGLMHEAAPHGLQAHRPKAKILWSGKGRGTTIKQTEVQGKPFHIYQGDAIHMYLGKRSSFEGMHNLGLKNGRGKACAKFGVYSAEPTDRRLDLKTRALCSRRSNMNA